MQQAAWKATPKSTSNDNTYEYPSNIRDKVALKRKVRKLYVLLCTKCPKIKKQLNHLAKEIKSMLADLRNRSFKTTLSFWMQQKQLITHC